MKKLTMAALGVLSLGILTTYSYADSEKYPSINKVSYQLSAEQWASTQTAKVIVAINATLNDQGLGTIQNQIMSNLQKIAANVDWHITQFQRSKNQSGLEQLYAEAEVRLPETALSDLRKNAESISQPGATYTIGAINFTPSQAEIEQVRGDLRNKIYTEAQAEIIRLNKVFSNESFYLYSIDFSGTTPEPVPVARTMMLVGTNAPAAAPMEVSNQVRVDANVVLGAVLNKSP